MTDISSRASQGRREWAMAFREWKKNKLDKPKLCVAKILLTTKYKTKMFSNLKAFMTNMSKYKNCQRMPRGQKKKKKVKPDGRPTLGKRRRTTEWQSQEYMHALLLIIWLFSKDVISQSNVIVFLNMYVSKMCAVCFVYYILTNLFKNKTIKITTKLKCNNGCIRIGRLKG